MKYDFIEIGTSDFDTLIESRNNQKGISIEPLKYYLDRLPNNPDVIKVNAALSLIKGVAEIFWVDPSDIENYGLPLWLKGCNSIYKPHPSTLKELQDRNLENLMKSMEIEVLD